MSKMKHLLGKLHVRGKGLHERHSLVQDPIRGKPPFGREPLSGPESGAAALLELGVFLNIPWLLERKERRRDPLEFDR